MLLDFPDKAFFNTRRKETQFATESRLEGKTASVEEIHFTAGNQFAAKLSFTYYNK